VGMHTVVSAVAEHRAERSEAAVPMCSGGAILAKD